MRRQMHELEEACLGKADYVILFPSLSNLFYNSGSTRLCDVDVDTQDWAKVDVCDVLKFTVAFRKFKCNYAVTTVD